MKKVAIFDFDHTLVTGDSFWPFLTNAVGFLPTTVALIEGLTSLAVRRFHGDRTSSLRTYVKDYLLHRLLKGKKRDELKAAATKTRAWRKFNPQILQALVDHASQGDVIVIASGGLDLYLPELLDDVPHQALICTDIGIENGLVTGDMINGNCVRLCKAERVGKWLADNGPFDESFGYGNYPHDVPMLNLVKHRIIVS